MLLATFVTMMIYETEGQTLEINEKGKLYDDRDPVLEESYSESVAVVDMYEVDQKVPKTNI
jgi:hypothetical protein